MLTEACRNLPSQYPTARFARCGGLRAPEAIIPRRGSIVPWASAFAVGASGSPPQPWSQAARSTEIGLDHSMGAGHQ